VSGRQLPNVPKYLMPLGADGARMMNQIELQEDGTVPRSAGPGQDAEAGRERPNALAVVGAGAGHPASRAGRA